MLVVVRIHGLRASSVENIQTSGFQLEEGDIGWTCLVPALKGKTAEAAVKLGSRRFQQQSITGHDNTPTKLLRKWLAVREKTQSLFGGLSPEPGLSFAMKNTFEKLEIKPPNGCTYQSHSCRIGAYTESLLCGGLPANVLLAQFNWLANNMPQIYFDHLFGTHFGV